MDMNTNYECIVYSEDGNIGTITINRPKNLNALNTKVLSELKDILTKLENNIQESKSSSLAGVILTGAGDRAFVAGADIKEMADISPEQASKMSTLGQEATLAMEELSVPIIATVDGFALGGGCEMAMGCDFILATNKSIFGQPEAKLGLIPGFGGTQRLAKLVGRSRAKEILYTGRNVSAQEAQQIGLVLQLFETKEEMMDTAITIISKISQNSPQAIAACKKTLNRGVDLTVQDGLQLESKQFGLCFATTDMQEGTKAFLEKRKANFR
ncbi:MAG: enoyl-CoA hydratase/isomerase family protein [Bacteriovoracaceae bacterium]|nr:enoyl-CoA hydratase/isomerase family protein [Bacteriovoracaceae bacterium]